MKVLWITSFRPFGQSINNDDVQNTFKNSLEKITNINLTLSLTQFEEKNIEKFINDIKLKKIFINFEKKNLPPNKKYSNKIMLENGLKQYIDGDYNFLVYSTADLKVPNNVFDIIKTKSNFHPKDECFLIYPNILIKNNRVEVSFWPHYGIDLFIFRLSKEKAKKFLISIKNWNQFDWGINDNFYVSVCDYLKLPITNLYKYCSAIKFENSFEDFCEDSNWQVDSWNQNKIYFKEYLTKSNLSLLYAHGSYFYLLYKILNIKDLNLSLFLSYIIFYIYYPIRYFKNKIKSIIKK